ncbi:MAG: Holliday junction branch migration protein RuvA [Bacillota bacterium]
MITFLKGVLVSKEPDSIVLDVGGVGYLVLIPKNAMDLLPPMGSLVQINTYFNLREDGATLYGFVEKEELNLFKQLISVTGIGPKVAINILGSTKEKPFVAAILNEDLNFLTKLPGVGKKTAQRLILDLKDKLQITEEVMANLGEARDLSDASLDDALQALLNLGYQKQEVIALLVKGKSQLGPGYSSQDLIRFVLMDQGRAGRG